MTYFTIKTYYPFFSLQTKVSSFFSRTKRDEHVNHLYSNSVGFIIIFLLFAISANAQDFELVTTGQVTAYDDEGEVITGLVEGDAFWGQDAHYLMGAEMSFQDNGDGTITDPNTGLMWQQVPSSADYTWQETVDYCDDLDFAGYDDWRIPSCKELYTISNFGTGWPYLDTDYFTLASGQVTKDEQYWSSDYYVGVTVEGGSNAAFGVNHVTGHIKAYAANVSGPMGGKYVRAVRGNNYGVNDYTDNGDATITDNASGLMWTQDDSGEGLDWEAALAYAEDAETAGYSDWRLPNVKELQIIVDYEYSPSATDASKVGPAIDPLFNCTPIVNEAGDDDYAYYWTSTSALFESGAAYYYAWYVAFGRAVDGNGDDFHGAGGVRFDTKVEGGPLGEGGERYYNYVRLVRGGETSTATYDLNFREYDLNVFPNPAQNEITLSADIELATVFIYNLSGQIVLEKNLNQQVATLNVDPLSNGMYFIKAVTKDGKVVTQKIVVEQ